jgi:lysyl-tRNA synthetase class II
MVMALTGTPSIKDVILFPLVRSTEPPTPRG